MNKLNLQFVGSLQIKRFTFRSENPLEEVWARISQLGSPEFMLYKIHRNSKNNNWDSFVKYSVIRVRQACEFRKSLQQTTLLTAPLPLYYSFLNLTRSILSLNSASIPTPSHGLTFKKGNNFLDNAALILEKGTFVDYLNSMNINSISNKIFTLNDCLSRIIEINYDYTLFCGTNQSSLVIQIEVEAMTNGDVSLIFPAHLTNFRSNWQQEFPSISKTYHLKPEGNVLYRKFLTPDYKGVSNVLHHTLETDLISRDTPIWYLIRQGTSDPILSRPAYYFISLFILSNIVRYQPELMLEISNPDSQLGWLLIRLLKVAERFYPQLMLSWLYDHPVYF